VRGEPLPSITPFETLRIRPSPEKSAIMPTVNSNSLSDEEYEQLADLLDEHASLDADGVLGLCHAIAVAPSVIPPSTWLAVILTSENTNSMNAETVQELTGLVMRCYNEVAEAVQGHGTIVPDGDDEMAFESFAAGFIAGAELDAAWVGDSERWALAEPLAYLAGRTDRCSPEMLDEFDANPKSKAMLSEHLVELITIAHSAFADLRGAGTMT
jgi:yecA family protein